MAEWFKAAVLKTAEVNSLREFESHLLRQTYQGLRLNCLGPFLLFNLCVDANVLTCGQVNKLTF